MVGGNNYRKSQFNLAVQGERQPGSSFKPFVLATALEEGVAPGTSFVSRPMTLSLDGTTWPVNNYEGVVPRTIDLQQATIHSDNSVYAQLTKIGRPGQSRAHRAQARDHKPAQAVPLDRPRRPGGQPARDGARVSRRSRTAAFASTDRSTGNHPRAILAVGDKHAGVVVCGDPHVHCNRMEKHRALRPDTAAAESSILQRVVTRGNGQRARRCRTARRRQDGHDRELRRRLVRRVHAAARHGGVGRLSDKLVPMTTQFHGDPVAGGTFPAMIWKTFMKSALKVPAVPDGQTVRTSPRRRLSTARPSGSRCGTDSSSCDNGICRDDADARVPDG